MVSSFRGAWALALLMTVAAGVAEAQEPSEADRHIAQGEALFAAENYDAALAELEAAYALLEGDSTRYYLLWNIGQCHERLFRYDRALEYYQRYLDEGGPEAEDRATVEATMHALDGLLARVEVAANVEAASIWVDGHEVGSVPATLRVPGGTHTVEVRAEGHTTEVREVQVAARETVRIEVTLRIVSDYQGLDPWLFWSTAGVAVATALVGGGIGIYALVEHGSVLDRPADTRSQEDRDRIGGLALAADVLYGTAGLFAVTAAVLAFLTHWGETPSAAPSAWLLPTFTQDTVGVSVSGSW